MKQVHTLTGKHWMGVRDPFVRVRGRIKGPEGERNSIGRQAAPTHPWELSETELLIKEYTQTETMPLSVLDVTM